MITQSKTICFAGVAAVCAFALAAHADWPEFRGPSGQGISTARNLPTKWSTTENVAWKQEIPGAGWSSPILHSGRIYLTTAVPPESGGNQLLRALCLDAQAGRTLWNAEVFSTAVIKGHAKNSQASPTPITDGERLYVHFGQYGTAALDLGGKVLWRSTSLNYPAVHGPGGSPILVGNAVIFSCDGSSNPFIVALSKTSGEVLWKTPRNTSASRTFSFSTPLAISVNGRTQVVSPTSAGVAAYDPTTGNEIWRARYAEGYSVIARPVFGHGLVFVSSAFDRPVVYAIRPDGGGDVTDSHIAWSLAKGAPNTPSMLLIGDELYFVSDAGIMSCVDAKTGKAHWQERVGGNYSASPLYADGRIYVQNEEGVGTVLKPGTTFEVLARNDLKEKTLASYAVDDGALFIRTASHLYRIQSR